MRNKFKSVKARGLSMLLMLIMLIGILPMNVLASEEERTDSASATSSTVLTPPIISTNRIGNQQAIFVDFSAWEAELGLEITNIDVETETSYVLPVITANAAVLVYPENVIPTASHRFDISVAIRGFNRPLLVGLNGLGAITNMPELPNTDGNGGNNQSNIPTAPPELNEDWFLNQDVINGNLPVTNHPDPNAPSVANGRLNVWGGEVFWDNDLEVWNFPQNTLVIRKENQVTGQLLAGARFSVTRVSSGNDSGLHGTVIGEFDTNSSGIIVIAGLDPGFYIVEELIPPTNFTLDTNTRQHVFMRPDDTSVVSVTFSNLPFGSMLVTLRDSVTSAPIPNGEFRITTSNGTVLGTNNGVFWTNLQGEILIPNIRPDSYIITQVTVPNTHVINLVQSTQTLRVNATGEIYRVDFFSDPLSRLLVTLRCEVTGQPIQGGEFRITNSAGNVVGSANGIFFTNQQGEILIPGLGADSYVVTQLNAPDGFRLASGGGSGQQNSQTIFVSRPAETYTLNFTNEPYSGLIIQNLDGYNGDPLPGVRFRIDRINNSGNVLIGEHITDNNGRIELTGLLGSFNITQLDVPNGWEFDAQPTRIAHVNTGAPTLVTFHSPRMGSLEITLQDDDGNPLAGGRFEVRRQNGQLVGTFTTNQSGGISIPNLGSGWFTIEQLAPPNGFVMTDTTRSVEVTSNSVAKAVFSNILAPALVIEKVDTEGNPLAGAEFEVRRLNGELIHRGTTNNGGIISIARLEPGAYTITETRPPQGFVITEPSRTIEITAGQTLTERFVNHRQPSLVIEKVDTDGNPLAGATFEVRTLAGLLIERIVTNQGGMATIAELTPGSYEIIETIAPQGFALIEGSRAIQIVAGQTVTERFINPRLATLVIQKVDGVTNAPLQGVIFEVSTLGGDRLPNHINNSFEFVTDNAGMIRLPNLAAGTWVITEIRPLPGYEAAEPVVLAVGVDNEYVITVRNFRYPDYVIRKIDGVTQEPLANVQFEIARYFADGRVGARLRNPVDGGFTWTTDNAGLIRIPNLEHGTYVAIETRPLPGYMLAEPVVFVVDDHEPTTITIRNYRYSEWNILKLDGDNNQPLPGVIFEVAHFHGSGTMGNRIRNNITGSFEFTTDAAGLVRIGALVPGTYIITETRPLAGFIPAEPVVITVTGQDADTTVTIRNYRMGDINLRKIDGDTDRPLQGVVFEIHRQNGERVQNPHNHSFEFVTDNAGRINLGFLAPGSYIAVEVRALEGYQLADPTPFEVISGRDLTVTVRNFRQGETIIRKIDGDTGAVLQGVVFEIRRINGERVQSPTNNTFEFTTDNAGLIRLGFLAAGTYVAVETRPLTGYTAGEPTTFEVIAGQDLTVVIRNYRQSSLTVRKINSVTRSPIEGVVFQISHPNGQRIQNPQTGFYDFVTDGRGLIFLPALPDGTYWLTEARPASGFHGLDEPILLEINSTTRQRNYLLEVENDPASGLLIIKTDAQTGRPLEGVIFEIRHADGRLVQSGILDDNQLNTNHNSPQLNAVGGFTTDSRGRINLNHLAPGVYHVVETQALPGYILDTTVHVVTVHPGQQAVLHVENSPLAGFRLLKVCAITGEGLFNVEFMVFDNNGKVVGVFYTDNNGVIDFSAILAPGRYTIRETRPAPGFARDDVPRTVEFVAGRVTEIVWENIPIAGQLQILKVSGDSNQHNGLPVGTPLAGAIFEIVEARTGNLVDRIISNDRGMAVSRPLPLGRYIAREVSAPAFYMINPQEIHFDLEHENQIVRVTFPNFSANMGVTIRKTGPAEAMQGHNIVYEIPVVRNDSSSALADFFWRDVLPTNAVRVDRLITGTYNHALRYRVLATTNRGNEIVVADNLSTLTNNVIELRPVHLGLAADEFIVDFTLYFGQVPAGFTSVERPRIFVDVLSANHIFLPDGMMFANKVDIGGRIPGTDEWVIGNSTTATTIFNPRRIPQSGW